MPPHETNEPLLKQLLALLDGGQAHATFAAAVESLPSELRGVVPEGLPHSAWQIVEHLRIAQKDILDFSDPPATGYQHLKWPDAYWPQSPVPPTPDDWEEAISTTEADLESFKTLLTRPEADLYVPFAWGKGQNLLREALLIADHNAYHTAELIVLRRLLGCWN